VLGDHFSLFYSLFDGGFVVTKMKTIVLTIAAMGVRSAPVLAAVIAPAFDDMTTSPQD